MALHLDRSTIQPQIKRRSQFLMQEIERERQTLENFHDTPSRAERLASTLIKLAITQMQAELNALKDIEATLLTPDP